MSLQLAVPTSVGECEKMSAYSIMLCGGQVLVEPVLTTTAACGTAVESSLSLAGLPLWSQTQAYTSNVYYSNLSQAV